MEAVGEGRYGRRHSGVCDRVVVLALAVDHIWMVRVVDLERSASPPRDIDQSGFLNLDVIKPDDSRASTPNAEIQYGVCRVTAVKCIIGFDPIVCGRTVQVRHQASFAVIGSV